MMDGKTQTVEIGGSENTNFEIYIGEQMVCSGDVDFTAGEILVSNMIESEYIFTAGQN